MQVSVMPLDPSWGAVQFSLRGPRAYRAIGRRSVPMSELSRLVSGREAYGAREVYLQPGRIRLCAHPPSRVAALPLGVGLTACSC
jgi:hypothetical protein